MLKDNSVMISTIQELYYNFKLCDLRPTFFLLSVWIEQDLEAHIILLSQNCYVDKLLKYFGIDNCNSIKTSLSSGTDLFSLILMHSEQSKIKSVSYLSVISSL